MAKEILLYTPIYDFVAEDLIRAMEENSGDDLVLRVNSPGGNVLAGWGIIAKMKERKSNVKIKVDGAAASMAFFMCLFSNETECLDVSTFVCHRAAYDSYRDITQEEKEFLDKVNNDLRAKLEAKIDAKKFKEVTGFSIKDVFESEERIDVRITAKQAKEIGLVNKINKLSPIEASAINSYFSVAAKTEQNNQPNNNQTMTKDEIKAKFPAVYAEIFAEGVSMEKDRVESILAFSEVATPAEIKAVVEAGKPLTQKQLSEFALKAVANAQISAVAKDGAVKPVVTAEIPKEGTEKEKQIAAFEASVDAKIDALFKQK